MLLVSFPRDLSWRDKFNRERKVQLITRVRVAILVREVELLCTVVHCVLLDVLLGQTKR